MSCYLKLKYTKGNSLGLTLESELKFEEHINKTCYIVNKKLNALHHIGNYMSLTNEKCF